MKTVKRAFALEDGREFSIMTDETGFMFGFWRPLKEGEKYPKRPKVVKSPAGTYMRDALTQYEKDATTPPEDCIKYISETTTYDYLNSPMNVLEAAIGGVK